MNNPDAMNVLDGRQFDPHGSAPRRALRARHIQSPCAHSARVVSPNFLGGVSHARALSRWPAQTMQPCARPAPASSATHAPPPRRRPRIRGHVRIAQRSPTGHSSRARSLAACLRRAASRAGSCRRACSRSSDRRSRSTARSVRGQRATRYAACNRPQSCSGRPN